MILLLLKVFSKPSTLDDYLLLHDTTCMDKSKLIIHYIQLNNEISAIMKQMWFTLFTFSVGSFKWVCRKQQVRERKKSFFPFNIFTLSIENLFKIYITFTTFITLCSPGKVHITTPTITLHMIELHTSNKGRKL